MSSCSALDGDDDGAEGVEVDDFENPVCRSRKTAQTVEGVEVGASWDAHETCRADVEW